NPDFLPYFSGRGSRPSLDPPQWGHLSCSGRLGSPPNWRVHWGPGLRPSEHEIELVERRTPPVERRGYISERAACGERTQTAVHSQGFSAWGLSLIDESDPTSGSVERVSNLVGIYRTRRCRNTERFWNC